MAVDKYYFLDIVYKTQYNHSMKKYLFSIIVLYFLISNWLQSIHSGFKKSTLISDWNFKPRSKEPSECWPSLTLCGTKWDEFSAWPRPRPRAYVVEIFREEK